jgi:feruloyl esterase
VTRQRPPSSQSASLISAAGAVVWAGSVLFATPAWAALPNCTIATLSKFAVPGVSVASATAMPANGPTPEYCSILGSVATDGEGAGPGSAEFVLKLPERWNNRLVFFGCGSNCGSVKDVAANPVDTQEALDLGYAVINTDGGHEQSPATPDPTWVLLTPGVPNEPAIIDFFYRAVHQTTVAMKALTEDYYAGKIDYAYFDGCSTGGRQSVMEGDRYPEDFDGLVAGDPIIDADTQRAATLKQAKAFIPSAAYIPFSVIPAIDASVVANCDLADGVADGLIQNPAQCSFDPRSLVPGTLTAAQAEALTIYLKELVDTDGRPVSPGMTVGYYATAGFEKETEIATPPVDPDGAEPWGAAGKGPTAWTLVDGSIRYFIERDPTYDVNNDWPQDRDVISHAGVRLLRERSREADADDPRKLRAFLRQGRKIILYHGFSDDQASPYRSIGFYKALAAQEYGYVALQEHARLFMVPGMGHCTGGSEPNSFDTLRALDDWVTKGVAPEAIVATDPGGTRTMPLCRFPEEARYVGGPIAAASSWACDATDERLLKIGVDGVLAGADRDYDADRDDRRGRE